jgi:chitinase
MTSNAPSRSRAVTLAFATGECGAENWAAIARDAFKKGTVAALDAASIKYVISTGGAAGKFTCSSAAKLLDFVNYYKTPSMVGVDFDIEGSQSQTEITNLVAGAKAAAAAFPAMRFSFTLATLGGYSNTSNLNSLGDSVMKAIASAGL